MIYEELQSLSGLKKDEDEPRERFIHRIIMAIDKLADEEFAKLSEAAQEYFNEAVIAHNKQEELPKFKDEEKEEIPEKEDVSKGSTKDGSAKIRILIDHNPKRKNSRSYGEFSLYRDGMTVDEYLKVGGSKAGIRWDIKHGFIKLET